jgi:hypothetical protein
MPTANNKVDGSIKDKSQVLDGPLIENRIRGSLFLRKQCVNKLFEFDGDI